MKNIHAILFLLISWLLLSSCTYYKVVKVPDPKTNPKVLPALENRTLILHGKERMYLVANPAIDLNRHTVSGILDSVPAQNRFYLPQYRENKRYTKEEQAIIRETHIFSTADSGLTFGDRIAIPLETLDRLDVIKKDKVRNTLLIAGIIYVPAMIILVMIFPPVTI